MSIETEYPEINERGQRFRRVGQYCIEYAPSTIVHAPAPPEAPPKPRKDCPFSGGMYPKCKENCAFFENDHCTPGKAHSGQRCPFPAHITCGDNCMMYDNGRCTLFATERNTK